jgi:ParB family chromosome partitioning protein
MPEQIRAIPLNELWADEVFNCRGEFSPLQVVDLAKDIERNGLIQPILVMPIDHDEFKYKIVAGYRRYAAHTVLKWPTIDCIIRKNLDEKSARIVNLSENLGREDLNIVQEAKAIQPLIDLGMSQEDIAFALPNTSRGWVQVRCMLLLLPEEVQEEAAAGILNQSDIRDLNTLRHKNATDDEIFAAVREMKDAKAAGVTRSKKVAAKLSKPKDKNLKRDRADIFIMIDHIMSSGLPGLHTRCLAWAAGEISDRELFADLSTYADELGKNYTPMLEYDNA